MNNISKLVVSVVACLGAGIIGSIFTTPAIPGWYADLKKPMLNPPNWLFGPVWTILFILMGVALFLVWQKGLQDPRVKTAIIVFLIQLMLNIAWSFLFFGMKAPLFAFIEIIILWFFILATIISFSAVSKWAAILLIPYILWVSFASYLTYMIYSLNR